MYRLTDKTLREKTIPFDFENPPMDPKELYDRMAETLIKNKGFGLSCNTSSACANVISNSEF